MGEEMNRDKRDDFACIALSKPNQTVTGYQVENIQEFRVQSAERIYVFCMDLRTDSNFRPVQHKLTGFYNRYGERLLRGTDWVFKLNKLTFRP